MKKFLLMVIVATMSLGASAQLISSNTLTKGEKVKRNYSRLGLSYNSLSMGGETETMSGVGLEWLKGISLMQDQPLFLEIGLKGTFNWWSDSEQGKENGAKYSAEVSQKYLSLAIPVNVTYRYAVTDNFRVSPYVGLYGRFGLLGQETSEWEISASGYQKNGEETFDWFDKDEGDLSRFQLGMQIGANIEYGRGYIGLGYGFDLTAPVEKADKWGNFSVTLGLTF